MKSFYTLILLLACTCVANAQGNVYSYDINTGQAGSSPQYLTIFKGKLYFVANDSLHGFELWSVDSLGKATMVCDLYKGSGTASGMGNWANRNTVPNTLGHLPILKIGTSQNDDLLFMLADNGNTGFELYKYDTTSPCQQLVFEYVTGANNNGFGMQLQHAAITRSRLYGAFKSQTYTTGYSVFEFTPSSGKLRFIDSAKTIASNFITYKDKLYYAIADTVFEFDRVIDVRSKLFVGKVKDMAVVYGKLYIGGDKLYEYDGGAPPIDRADYFGTTNGSWPISGNDSNVYFPARSANGKVEPWEYNPKTKISRPLRGNGMDPHSFISFNNKLYYFAYDSTRGFEMWYYDGISFPSFEFNINQQYNLHDKTPLYLTVFGGSMYFSGDMGTNGWELLRYTPGRFPALVGKSFFNNMVEVFPNPATDLCTLRMNLETATEIKLVVCDAAGKVVYTQDASVYPAGQSTISIDTRAMSAGVYYVRLHSTKNEMLYTAKLLKQ